ncbi:hypothetical protein, partial [Methylobacterium oxalidis]
FGTPRITISQWNAMVSAHQSPRSAFVADVDQKWVVAEGWRTGMRSIVECLVAFAILLALVVASYTPALGRIEEFAQQTRRAEVLRTVEGRGGEAVTTL